jgi:hypothetical protein
MENTVLDVAPQHRAGLQKLINLSHEHPMDLLTTIRWDIEHVDRSLPPKLPSHSWIYATGLFQQLDDAQKMELLWLEIARDVSMFIALEQTIPVLYMTYVNKYGKSLPEQVYQYLMIFSKEEIIHTMVFRRFLEAANLPTYETEGSVDIFLNELPGLPPIVGILNTLIIEWVAEQGAITSTQDDCIDPLTRKLFHHHHIDEARHIAFARWITECHLAHCSDAEKQEMKRQVRMVLERLIPAFSFNPDIQKYTSFKFSSDLNDPEIINRVVNSESNRKLNEKRFAPIFTWLRKIDLW